MEHRLFAARGAVQVETDDRDAIIKAVTAMYDRLVEDNAVQESDMVCIQFSITRDLRSLNPAAALRTRDARFAVPLFCMQEPDIEGMMPRTIRMLIQFYAPVGHCARHAYLGGAGNLRPEFRVAEE